MLVCALLLLISCFARTACAALLASTLVSPSDVVPGKFIVEFDAEGHQSGYADLADSLSSYLRTASAYTATPFIKYDHPDIFFGAAIDVAPKPGTVQEEQQNHGALAFAEHIQSEILAKLRKAPKVRKVWPSRYIHLTRAIPRYPETQGWINNGVPFPERASDAETAGNTTSTPAQVNVSASAPRSAHILTGVSLQHERGNYGAGVKACVVDSPVDYSHPAFNGNKPPGTICAGKDCRFEGGYEWFGPATKDSQFLPRPLTLAGVREHPLDCSHGSHTLGLLGSDDPRILGVAPESHLRSYAPFSCLDEIKSPTVAQADAVVLEAVIKAAADGCDVINASIGADRWPSEPVAIAASRASRQGHTFVASAGNSGADGMDDIASPGAGESVICVGASNDDVEPGISLTFNSPLQDGTTEIVALSEGLWTYNITLNDVELVFVENSSSPDLPANGLAPLNITEDLSRRILVLGPVYDGDSDLQDQNIAAVNATHVLVTEGVPGGLSEGSPDTAVLKIADTQKLYQAWKQNRNLTVSVNVKDPLQFATIPNIRAGQITDFSSLGPAYDGSLKPDVLAPGSEIVSSIPLPYRYGAKDGTSMSSPIAAGAVALLKSAKGLKTPFETIRKRLVQSARPLKVAGSDKLLPVFYQGGGVINITAAIDLTTLIEPYRLFVGDSAARQANPTQNFTVTNVGEKEQSYKLSHVAAQSVLALRELLPQRKIDTDDNLWLNTPEPIDAAAGVTFSPTEFTLPPGQSHTVIISLQSPADNPRLLAFSGFINVQSSQPEGTSQLPYAGFTGSYRDVPVIGVAIQKEEEGSDLVQLPGLYNSSSGDMIADDNHTSTLNLEREDSVFVKFSLSAPSEVVYCDLVSANTTYKASIPTDLSADSVIGKDQDKSVKFADVPVVLRLDQVEHGARTAGSSRHNTCFAKYNGTNPLTGEDATLPEGDYRILIRAHRWTSDDYTLDASFESYLSHSFRYIANTTVTVS